MRVFQIDVSNCKLPEFWKKSKIPMVIRIGIGRYQKDFDVIDEVVNKKVRAIPEVLGNNDMPVGFNMYSIPVGATITRLPDEAEQE